MPHLNTKYPLLALLLVSTPVATGQVSIVASEDSPVPGMPGEYFSSFGLGEPRIDDTGVLWFTGSWGVALSDSGLFNGTAITQTLVLQNRAQLSGLPDILNGFNQLCVARSGLSGGVAFVTTPSQDMIVLLDQSGVQLVHNDGELSPTTEGNAYIRQTSPITINNSGDVSYSIVLGNTIGGDNDNEAILLWNKATNAHHTVVREGDSYPSGGGGFNGSCYQASQAFCAPFIGQSGPIGFAASGGVFLFSPLIGTVEAARVGTPAPGGGTFSSTGLARPNSSGELAFTANIQGNSSFDAAYLYHNGTLLPARLGDPAPTTAGGVNGIHRTPFSTSVTLSDFGELCFYSDTYEPDGSGGNRVGEGLFAFDGFNSRALARRYEPAPGGGIYANTTTSTSWTSNDVGQTLFTAGVDTQNNGLRTALFLNTPGQGTRRLLTVGDVIDGRTLTSITGMHPRSRGAGALNNEGEVVVQVNLDGDRAILFIGNCPADVNGDGMLSPTDFTAWIGAFNTNAPECDQNGDGMCTPTDFSAWIGNYNAGC